MENIRLLDAIVARDEVELRRIVQVERMALNEPLPDWPEGMLPLVYAANSAGFPLCQLLVGLGAALNVTHDRLQPSPLMNAVSFGFTEAVETLIRLGADVNELSPEKFECAPSDILLTPLCLAIKKKNFNVVRLLLENGADINKADVCGDTAVHYMVRNSHGSCSLDRILDRLPVWSHITSKPDLNCRNVLGMTPLMFAVESNNVPAVRRLIEENVNMESQDYQGFTALHHAVARHLEEVTLALLRAGCAVFSPSWKISPLYIAAERNDNLLCDILLEFGANATEYFSKGNTLLHIAAIHGNLRMIDLALRSGVPVDACNNDAVTPLMATRRNWAAAKFLVQQCRARTDLTDAYNNTALGYCLCSTKCAVYLIVEGIPRNDRDYTAAIKNPEYKTIFEFLMLTEKLPLKRFVSLVKQSPDNDFVNRWHLKAAEPLSLKHFCRLVIRDALVKHTGGRGIVLYVSTLPLPTTLKNYVCYRQELQDVGLSFLLDDDDAADNEDYRK